MRLDLPAAMMTEVVGLAFDEGKRIQVPRQEKAQTNELTMRVVERKGLEAFVVTTKIEATERLTASGSTRTGLRSARLCVMELSKRRG